MAGNQNELSRKTQNENGTESAARIIMECAGILKYWSVLVVPPLFTGTCVGPFSGIRKPKSEKSKLMFVSGQIKIKRMYVSNPPSTRT